MSIEKIEGSKWRSIGRAARHLRSVSSLDHIVDLAICQVAVGLSPAPPACIVKCVVTVFLDEPTPGSSRIYVELVGRDVNQIELKFFDHTDVNTIESKPELYADNRTCVKLIQHFKRSDSHNSHHQPLSGSEEQQIAEVKCVMSPVGVSQDDRHSSVIVDFPGTEQCKATWLTWTANRHSPILGHSPVPIAFRVRTERVSVKGMYFWVFLPRGYRQVGEECLVHDGGTPFDTPVGINNPVFAGRIGREFPVFKEWSGMAFGKLILRNKDVIKLDGIQNVLLSLRAVSDELDAQGRRQSLMAGVLIGLGASVLANLLFACLPKDLGYWLIAGIATVSVSCILSGWREYRR